ncbi:M24 family metallopeptidase [candidate division KSB1 bacterium]
MDINRVQQLLEENNIDGWLLYDFQNLNAIVGRMLELPENVVQSRRYFYFIPRSGTPRKLVHRIEQHNLDLLPGDTFVYLDWQSLGEGLKTITEGAQTVAMEFSPHNAIPYVARVDAGTVDLMRFIGKEVVSSANLIQEFEAALSDEQIETHLVAAKLIRQFVHNAFGEIQTRIKKTGEIKEYTVQQFLVKRFKEHNLVFHHPALVAVNANAGNPHYMPNEQTTALIRENDLVLIDLFGKLNKPKAIYADITWMGFTGETIPAEIENAFTTGRRARDTAVDFVRERFAAQTPVMGFEVDDAARNVIKEAGYGDLFIHRTGHSIGEEVHGNGANMDNLETHDNRRIIPRTCFSIEPGIYTDAFGIRTEINMLIMPDGAAEVTGGEPQQEIVKI